MSDGKATFEGWCLLELMGHRKLAGYVTETTVAGAGFVRIDVPGISALDADLKPEGEVFAATQLYAPAAVYAITPITEALARRVAAACQPAPVSRWELPESREATVTGETCRDCGFFPCTCAEEGSDADF